MRPGLYQQGVALTVESTFGLDAATDLGASPAPGFDVDADIGLLVALDVTAVRLTFDWARLQPHPERVDAAWIERYDEVLAAAGAAGLEVWACALDRAVPQWFDNDGGVADVETLTRRWPRWFEIVVDRWGDRIAGWVPFDIVPAEAGQAWTDTRGILRGATAPVVYSIDIADPATDPDDGSIEQLSGPDRPDADALAIAGPWTDGARAERKLTALAEIADVAIARAGLSEPMVDAAADLRRVVDDAADDEVPLLAWFADPWRIADGDALVGRDGQPTDAADTCMRRP